MPAAHRTRTPQPPDPSEIEFRYAMQVPIGDPYDPGRLFDRWHVTMQRVLWSDDDESELTQLAHASAVVIHPFRFLHERSIFDAADEDGGDLNDLVTAAIAADGHLAEDLQVQLAMDGSGLLFLDNVTVAEERRGHGYGWQLAAELIVTLGHRCAAVLIFPAPPGGRSQMSDVEHEAACRGLAGYWERLGFFPAGRDNLYLLDPAVANPELLEALGPGRYIG